MSNRSRDWYEQSRRDLDLARQAKQHSSHEWACFAAQQAAEKAVKAVILSRGGQPWGHSVLALVTSLPSEMIVPTEVVDAARELDKLYVPTRYPNGFDQGKPGDYFTDKDASRAIEQATIVLDYSERHLPRP